MITELDRRLVENIKRQMRIRRKKQADLAVYMGLPRQTVYKILTGQRTINAVELKMIADFLEVSMETLLDGGEDTRINPLSVFKEQVSGKEALQGLQIAEEIMDMFLAQRKDDKGRD